MSWAEKFKLNWSSTVEKEKRGRRCHLARLWPFYCLLKSTLFRMAFGSFQNWVSTTSWISLLDTLPKHCSHKWQWNSWHLKDSKHIFIIPYIYLLNSFSPEFKLKLSAFIKNSLQYYLVNLLSWTIMISFPPELRYESKDQILFNFVFPTINIAPDVVTQQIFTWK